MPRFILIKKLALSAAAGALALKINDNADQSFVGD